MKVKNIMFSGAMASILMIGGAYAADLDPTALTTVSFVKGGVTHAIDTAESYTDTAIADLDATASKTAGADGLALSITEENGKITAISGSIAANTYDSYGAANTAETNAVNAAKAIIGDGYSSTSTVASAISALQSAVGSTETALGTRVTNLETKVGSSSVADQISTALTGYTTTADLNTSLAGKADAATTYSKTDVDGLISNEVSRANNAYDAKGAAAAVQGETTMTVEDVVDLVGDTAVATQISTAVAAEESRATEAEVALAGRLDTAEGNITALQGLVGATSVGEQIDAKITEAGLGEIVGSTYVTVTSANGKTTISVPNVADTWSD